MIRPGRRRRREKVAGLLLLAPSLTFLLVFSLGPLLQGISLSFHRLSFAQDEPGLETRFVGLDNYVELARSREFREAVKNTGVWVGGSVSARLVFGMVLALLLKRETLLARVSRHLALLPWVMPAVVAGSLWRWMFNGEWGILNHILKQLGLVRHNIIWMSMPGFRWFYIFSLSVWKEYPLFYVVILARLQGIPADLYEAAKMDGAGGWACFRYITLPMLRPIVMILVLLGVVWATTDFTNIWMLTGRGTTLATMAYQLAFRSWHMGYGATVGTSMLLILSIFGGLYAYCLRGEMH